MKGIFKRMVTLVMAMCLCATMIPGVAALAVPKPDVLYLAVDAEGRADGDCDVIYTARLTMSETFAKIVSVNRTDSEKLKNLRFTCVLSDGLVKQLSSPKAEDVHFYGPGSDNFEFISVDKVGDDVHIVYKLKADVVDRWKLMGAKDVKDDLRQNMIMTSTKSVNSAHLEAAKNDNGVIRSVGKVLISSVDGKIPYFDATEILAAEGAAILGGQAADPSITGVDKYLNTDDHVVFMVGDDKGTFRPDANITRAEVVQMFYALLKDKDVKITVNFDDVDADAWYATAVNTMASLGVVKGVGDNKFAPERDITRAEFATIAAQFTKASEEGAIFEDVPKDHWAYSYITTVAAYGWVMGVGDGRFEPDRTILRAEAATIVNNMLGRIGDYDKIDANEGRQFPDVSKAHWGWYEIAEATTAHGYKFNSDKTVETWVK